ncbi:transcription factor adf-1 [Plakobranchus ocellatus]|uniref:Transcription factor adf-1 n=1 Tax=Plakobranchus ocellatus TaxID=259542 RepID=A0AAV4CFP5_9GAST|nr:transcription factor adf-1 [Plakobranchus ocellatus]
MLSVNGSYTMREVPETALRKKWRYLRDNFAVEYGKRPISRSGDSGDNCPQPKWAYYKQLLFLKDVVTPRASSGSLRSFMATSPAETVAEENTVISVETDVASEPVYSEVSQEASPEAWNTFEQIVDSRDTSVGSESQETEEGLGRRNFAAGSSVAQSTPSRPRKRKQPGQEDYFQTLIELEKQKVGFLNEKQSKKIQEGDDADLMFFKSLLPHVKRIPPYKKLRFQSRIQAVVEEFAYPEQGPLDEEIYSQLAEDDLNRVKRLEGQLTSAQMELEKLENQQINLIQEIAMEIDALVETVSIDATSKCAPINGLRNLATTGSSFPSHLLTEIKNKIKWIKSEFRERLLRERRLRQEFRAALSSSDADRKFLVSELARKDEELDDVVAEKQVIAMKEIQTQSAVEELEEHVLDLSDELVVRRLREEEQRRTFAREKQHIIDDMEDILDAQKEKDKIEQRYKRLQDTLKSLHQDLKSDAGNRAKSPSRPSNGILRSTSPYATPRKRNNNHVRISPATPTKEFNKDDPVTPATTPPPLALSDDEFRSRFIPRTPQDVS